VTSSDADFAPRVVGRNVTLMPQVAPPARGMPEQVSDASANWPASLPLNDAVSAPVAAPPMFVTVNACAAEAWPTVTFENAALVGAICSAPGRRPVPESMALAVPPVAAVIASVADFAPPVAGANWTVTAQLPPAGIAAQPLVVSLNSAALVPTTATVGT